MNLKKVLTQKSFFLPVLLAALLMSAPAMKRAQQAPKPEKKDSVVVLTEYGDYECPACGFYNNWVKRLRKDFGDNLKVDFRNFPLSQHQYSMLAARAAEAARNQGKFWEMHDMLYDNQKEWSEGNAQAIILKYAQSLNLNMEKFKNDLNSAKTQKTVMEDKKEGMQVPIHSTPTFMLKGKKIDNPKSYAAFKQLIQQQLDTES